MTRLCAGPVTVVLLMSVAACAGCGGGQEDGNGSRSVAKEGLLQSIENEVREGETMRLSSTFQNGEPIAKKHTGEGDDLSPPLSWAEAPAGAKTFALICDDPDAPSPRDPGEEPWVHWVIYNIPGEVSELPEGLSQDAELAEPAGARQGVNSWGNDSFGYRGPLPPPGSGTHRYFFKLYALDTQLDLPPAQATKTELLRAMQGHILGQGELMGTYARE